MSFPSLKVTLSILASLYIPILLLFVCVGMCVRACVSGLFERVDKMGLTGIEVKVLSLN